MAEHPGVPALVGLGTGAFGIFAHGSFIMARLAVGKKARFAVVDGQYFPYMGRA